MKSTANFLILGLFLSIGSTQVFTLKSIDFGGQITLEQVYDGFGCTGQNISPELTWENPPEGTKSFAITMFDPDAPTGSGWWHWIVFDIPVNILSLDAGAGDPDSKMAPKNAIQSLTNYGTEGYGGPCPPTGHGFHQYIITIHALSVETLGLDDTAQPALAGFYINANTIQKASIIAYYQR